MTGHYAPKIFLLGGFLLALSLLSGCTTTKSGSNGASGSATVAGNILRYPLTTEPTDIDTARVEDGTTIDMLQNIFAGLVRWNDHSEIVPDIAEKWDVTGGGTIYTFHLKHGIKFHNGRELTADDFKFSLDRACNPATKSTTAASYLNDIVGAKEFINRPANASTPTEVTGVKVVDPYTLQITIDAPKSYWLGKMTYPTGYAVCREAIEKNGGVLDEKSAVGTGPFRLDPVDFQRGSQVTLTANEAYQDGRPKLDKIVRPILKDASTRLSNYEAGNLDNVEISAADIDHINGDPNLKPALKTFPRAATWYVALNSAAKDSPFGNRDVRRAFAMAVDKDEVVRVGMKNLVPIATGIVPPNMGAYAPKIKLLPYDPTQAKALLAKAGFPDGKGLPALTFNYRNDKPEVGAVAQVIAQQLKTNLNINIQCQSMEWATFLKERTTKTMAISYLRWGADYLDPQDYLSTLLHTSRLVNNNEDHPENGVGYSSPEFDKLCDAADIESDSKKRFAMYERAEQIAVDDAPWIPIYYQRDVELVRPGVTGVRDSLLGHLPHLTTTVGK